MKICNLLLKNFGKFQGREIELKEGINILYGKNESGKTTLHSFIRGMFYGIERGRGRASVNDTYMMYEPWDNAAYYSGALRLESGGKIFRIERNFDRHTKKADLVCETDGEQLSVEEGDLDMLLGGLSSSGFDNTVSIGQMKVETGQSLDAEFRNYAMNYYQSGAEEINLEAALNYLREKQKSLDQQIRQEMEKRQEKRERIEQESSYVWRDVHRLEMEREHLDEELHYREKKEQEREKEQNSSQNGHSVVEEFRADKWRVHPLEIILFIVLVIGSFALIPRPWNYLVAIVIFLACGLYIWNRMKVGKKQEKTEPELILEEITPEEEKIPLKKLAWGIERIDADLKEKRIQYDNLQEQLAELDEISGEFQEWDRKREAFVLAQERLKALSQTMQEQLEARLNQRASQIIQEITNGHYDRLLAEDHLHLVLLSKGKRVPVERVSRGTLEQAYFALRMAAGEMLLEEEMPVILDDTFVNYDDERLERTLQWLVKNRKQVLIFTCQKREEQALLEREIAFHKVVV